MLFFGLIVAFVSGVIITWLALKPYYRLKIKEEVDKAVKEAKEQFEGQSRATIKGQLAERLLPFDREKFPWNPSDARFIGHPIDYIVFDGYTDVKDLKKDKQIQIIFVEVKTGKSSTGKEQNKIEEAVEQKRVLFHTIHIEE